MLDEALRVVEAARGLGLERMGAVTRSSLPPVALAKAIGALLDALERFDRDTGSSVTDPGPRPSYAYPRPASPDEVSPAIAVRDNVPVGQEVEPEEVLDNDPALPQPALRRPRPAPAGTRPELTADLGDGAFFDGDESAADLMIAIDSINDKLAYAVTKVGWSPRLRALAEAARIAQNNMYIEVDGSQGWVRIPALSFGTLSLAIAEAALDQDLSIALPAPRPDPDRSYDHDHLPRPRPRVS